MGRLLSNLRAELDSPPKNEARCESANPANPAASRAEISEISGLATKSESHRDELPAVAMRDRLLILADTAGVDRAHVNGLGAAAVAACAGLDDDQLAAYLCLVRDTTDRLAGRVPAGDTARMLCKGCGPVWIHPTIAEVLPVVDGWPRALGCPWCVARKAGACIPRPPVTCDGCRHFAPGTINPRAGMGRCNAGKGAHYPMARHGCGTFDPTRG